jgi:hypothetical protein
MFVSTRMKRHIGKALIEDNGIPLSKSITQHIGLLNSPLGDV